MLHVELTKLDIPVDLVIEAAAIAAQVSVLNRNKNAWKIPLTLITDSGDVVKAHVKHAVDHDFQDRWLGLTYYTFSHQVIWLSPRGTSGVRWYDYDVANWQHRVDVANTLVHELSHSAVGGQRGHNWTFRRMYTLLLDLIGNDVLSPWVNVQEANPGLATHVSAFNVEDRVKRIIERYQRIGDYYRPTADTYDSKWSFSYERRDEELARHLAALDRMRKKITKIYSSL